MNIVTERKTRILGKLAEEGDKTADFFRAVPREAWDLELYSDGMTWTIRAVMYHVLDTEYSFYRLFENVLSGGEGVPADFKLDAYNNERVGAMGAWDPAGFVPEFLAARKANIALFDDATDADLDRIGRHPALGMKPLEDMLKIEFLHNRMHQKDITQALAQRKA